ncbi:MAG: hypothetical protein Q2306_01810 [Phytoplasma sp.]|uniref:hypothetical protein n=1 Tax=Phytoplasma sp. TaxID=2155 RepID=UPI002B40FDB2|nr:hypothetical protein [Phytoplasma sp.]WRH06623.1 MAG: hypothetical protein Q2306_01810 [Phytoplasma sp.]
MIKMKLCKKMSLFYQETLMTYCSRSNRYFRWFIIILGFISLCFVSAYKVRQRDVWKKQLHTINDVFDKDEINNYYLNSDRTDTEKTFIYLKGMIILIIIGIIFLGLKKGLMGISLGTFIGSCLGIWISICFPSIIYFLEFIFSGKIFSN